MQKSNLKAEIAFFGIFFLVGTVFTLIGISILVSTMRNEKLCIVEAPATVIRMEQHRSKSSKTTKTVYSPVLEYTYHGVTYTYVSNVATNPPKYHAGQKVTIMLNPDDPQMLYISGDNSSYWLCGIFIAVGSVCGLAGFVNILKRLLRRRHSSDYD